MDRSSFKTYFQSRIANTLAQGSASNSVSAASFCRARIVNQASPVVIGGVNDDDLSLEPQAALPAYVARRVPAVARHSAR